MSRNSGFNNTLPRFISQRNLKVCFVFMNGDCIPRMTLYLLHVCVSLVMLSLLLLLSKLETSLIVFCIILSVLLLLKFGFHSRVNTFK